MFLPICSYIVGESQIYFQFNFTDRSSCRNSATACSWGELACTWGSEPLDSALDSGVALVSAMDPLYYDRLSLCRLHNETRLYEGRWPAKSLY